MIANRDDSDRSNRGTVISVRSSIVDVRFPEALPPLYTVLRAGDEEDNTSDGAITLRCHVDLTNPDRGLWNYLVSFIEKYDAVIFSIKDYQQQLKTPQLFFMPAIDPFSILNREMNEEEIKERLDHYHIPTDLPIIVQIPRFDRWKDPKGVIEAFKIARKEVDATLVLLGNVATDDPEGAEVYESLLDCREERIIIVSHQDTALVNALQRRAAVVLQKSIREGFGLTVAEAMWKGAAVIGGNVGGIRYQIKDGENGFLVSSIEETAERMITLINDGGLRRQMGEKAKGSVRDNFLLSRYLEQYLDLFSSFETIYRLRNRPKTEYPVSTTAHFHIGTSGWHYVHWRGPVYPEDLRPEAFLEYYRNRSVQDPVWRATRKSFRRRF